jgi:long-chain acyl-CoA synthetase
MTIGLALYRRQVVISSDPRVALSAIDIAPEHPRRTFLFIHGFGGHARHWEYQLNHFALDSRVIAIDLRGHGRSDPTPSDYTMDDALSDLHAALVELGVEGKVIVVGHSFGGAIAAEFAARYPETTSHLVLIATTGEFEMHFLYRIALRLPGPILRMLQPITSNWLGASPPALKPWYHNIFCKWNGFSLFRSLTVPTLVILGHRDIVHDRSMYEEVARVIPGAEVTDVGASGHMVMLERRDAVSRAIQRFLDDALRTWRDKDAHAETSARAELIRQRPWLAYYEKRVPFTIAIPCVPVHQFLEAAVRRFPRRSALVFEGRRISYRQLDHLSNRFANALLSLGLKKGDRVLLLMPNLPQLVIGYFGILKAGGVVVFSLPVTEPEELIRQISDSGARFLATIPQMAPSAEDLKRRTQVEHVILTQIGDFLPGFKRFAAKMIKRSNGAFAPWGDLPLGTHKWLALLREQPRRASHADIAPEDPAVIIYTGGTTAEPKGVLLTHRNLVSNTIQTRHWIPEAEEGKERILCVLPFSHSYGLTTGLNVAVAMGATMVVKPRFEVQDTLKAIRQHAPTIFPGVPQMYVAISNFRGVRRFKIQSVRACISGSAPLPVEVQEAFEKLTRGRLVEGYGLTEASPVTHANPLHGRRKVGSIGIPIPSTEARIVDLADHRKFVAPGQIGELVVRGPQVMEGYWNDPQATSEALTKDGWLLTGDVAQADVDGYFRIVARKADMWYPGKPGKPAFPRDVEEVLYEIPQVQEAAVVAINGKPVAFIIAKRDRPSAETIFAYCQRRLPPGLIPGVILFLDDFPRTFIGKVLRRELAALYVES